MRLRERAAECVVSRTHNAARAFAPQRGARVTHPQSAAESGVLSLQKHDRGGRRGATPAASHACGSY